MKGKIFNAQEVQNIPSGNKRMFYTCPIKAAYMSHKFGVITYVELSIESEIYDKYFIKNWNHRELKLDPKEEHYCDKYYVAKESEKIFKFKGSDLVKYGFDSIDFYNKISQKNSVYEIIYRDNKQFFMPEVEND